MAWIRKNEPVWKYTREGGKKGEMIWNFYDQKIMEA